MNNDIRAIFAAGRKTAVVQANGEVSTGTGRDAVAEDIASALESVSGRKAQSRTVQESDHVEGHQHQRSHQHVGHTRIDAHVAVLEGNRDISGGAHINYWSPPEIQKKKCDNFHTNCLPTVYELPLSECYRNQKGSSMLIAPH